MGGAAILHVLLGSWVMFLVESIDPQFLGIDPSSIAIDDALEARTSIVIWNDTPGTCAASGQFGAPVVIQSKLVRNITGILYLPRSNLTVRKDSDVASQSWWTCIVAGAVTFEAGAKVYLNAAYTGAPVQPPPTILNNPDLPGTVLTQ